MTPPCLADKVIRPHDMFLLRIKKIIFELSLLHLSFGPEGVWSYRPIFQFSLIEIVFRLWQMNPSTKAATIKDLGKRLCWSFLKVDNFCNFMFASPDDKNTRDGVQIDFLGKHFLSFRVDPTEKKEYQSP